MGLSLSALEEALAYLFARTTGQFKFGLERTEALLATLGNPHRDYPVLHVAGTNGKGSSLATAEALLIAKGLRVGKYTSPHLVDFRERVLVNRAPIDGDLIVDFVKTHTPLVEELGASFFEATTAMAFEHFAREKVDVALIEVGLGGRLDSTNVVSPVAAGVTSIGWDHMEYLGHTLDAIAREKAGVFKKGVPAVIGDTPPEVREVLCAEATRHGATPVLVSDHYRFEDVDVREDGTIAEFTSGGKRLRLQTPLAGRHQAHNLAFTLTLLAAAGERYAVSLADAEAILPTVRLPGRFQRVGKYIFDVAHNADGARVLADTLKAVNPPRPLKALFCALRDKEWKDMLTTLGPRVDAFVLTDAPTAPASRAWNLEEAREFVKHIGLPVEVGWTFEEALRLVEDAESVLVTGSFHTVGDAMARLQVSPFAS